MKLQQLKSLTESAGQVWIVAYMDDNKNMFCAVYGSDKACMAGLFDKMRTFISQCDIEDGENILSQAKANAKTVNDVVSAIMDLDADSDDYYLECIRNSLLTQKVTIQN